MANDEVLDSERLKTDPILKLNKLTDWHRFMYENALGQARLFRQGFEKIQTPKPEDLSLLFQETMAFGFSQQALAARFGVTTGTFSRWVNAENPPREYARKGILDELAKIVDYIVGRLEAYKNRHPSLKQPRRPLPAKRLRLVQPFVR